MSKLSLFETNWINLVFEYKNKGYGRINCVKKAQNFLIFAFHGYLIMYCPLSFPRIVSLINPEAILGTIPDRIDQIITVTKVFRIKSKENDQLYLKLSKNIV
jgi:protein TonB